MAPLYALLAGLVVVATLLVLHTSHVLYATLGLLCVLLGIASIYFLQGAAFLAVTHVIVYGGGVSVLVLFGTLLLPISTKITPKNPRRLLEGLVTGLVGGGLWPLIHFSIQTLQKEKTVYPLQEDVVTEMGLQLLGPYALAFEWVGLNLLVALVGAVYIMRVT